MKENSNHGLPISWPKVSMISCAIILLCSLGVLILSTISPYIWLDNYSYVAENFAEALMRNNKGLAKRLAVPSQWDRLDGWMSTHQPYKCPFSWNPDDYWSFSGAGMTDEGARVTYVQSCWPYKFAIEEIILQRNEDRWQVLDWSEVKETR
jgi:hypothetical protein